MGRRSARRRPATGALVGIGVALVLASGLAARAEARPAPRQAAATTDPVAADWHTLRTPPLDEGQFEILTVSTLPGTVTGGDVLVAIRGVDPSRPMTVTAGDRDVSDVFAPIDGELRGLVTGLPEGPTVITATDGRSAAALEVVNHPVTGPVISGPHQRPFECRTVDAGLGEPIDENCSIRPRHDWYYRSSQDQGFHRLEDPYAAYPDDVATTETDDGEAVPFVVRVESRTINRGITRIAVLDDPAGRGPDAPFEPTRWNDRVYYAYGESCGVGYHQGTNAPETVLGALNVTEVDGDNLLINLIGLTERLGQGDITVHSTLSSFGVHCNPLISVETTMMVKEHIQETYGLIDALVGTNGSGAALQQYNAANNAPGLISAAMPTASFADIVTTAMTVSDCGLLDHYFATTDLDWTTEQKAAVTGHHILTAQDFNAICTSWRDTFLDRLDPTRGCHVDERIRYHPTDNPSGVRCTIQDGLVNLLGTDPSTGFARRPLDNVGVQYGLDALGQGTITVEQFVDLNEKVGGYDIDGRLIDRRHSMSSDLASLLYSVGGVIGRGALDETPVLDLAPYLDLIPIANIHEAVRPFVIRQRLRTRSDTDLTQAIWRGVVTQADAYEDMEAWLAGVEANRPGHGGDHAAAVIAGRPAGFGDRCVFGTIGGRLDLPESLTTPLGLAELPLLPGTGFDGGVVPLRVDVPEDFDSGLGPCSQALPVGATPRMAAGMPLSDDVIKCQRRPIDPADYPGATPGQLDRLTAAFPSGVCDYTKPAAEDVEESMLWVSVGSTQLQEPHELHWWVGRSEVIAGSSGAAGSTALAERSERPASGGGQGRLPATGRTPLLPLGLALSIAGVALARHRAGRSRWARSRRVA